MKNKKLMIVLLVISMVFVTVLSACSSTDNDADISENNTSNNNTQEDQTSNNNDQSNQDEQIWEEKFENVVITTGLVDDGTPRGNAFTKGDTIDDNVHLDWMKKNMGIEVKFDFITAKTDDYNTRLRLLLSSNAKLPDVFNANRDILQDLLDAGKLMPLDEHIDKYAHPKLKEVLEVYSYTLGEVRRDGEVYGLPRFFSGDEGTIMWIRQDWLDHLNLKAPANLDELEHVLKAFTEQDPNQSGEKDTFGLAMPLKQGPWTWLGQSDVIVGAITNHMINTWSINSYWNEDKNGKLVYGAVHPDAKDYLEVMQRWMSNGYMDQEAGIKDPVVASEAATSGKAGVMFGPFWAGGWPLGDTAGEGAEWKPYPLIEGPNGKARAQKSLANGYMVFSKDFEHMDAWFAYYNKIFAKKNGLVDDPYFDPRFADGYHEGFDYVTHNGEVIRSGFEEAGVPKEKWPLPEGNTVDERFMIYNVMGTMAPIYPYYKNEALQYMIQNPEAKPKNDVEADIKRMGPDELHAAEIAMKQSDKEIPNLYTGALTDTMKSKGEFLTKMATESYLKIIHGSEPISYFDEFVKQWHANGGDQVTKEVNEWYKTQK